MEKAGKLQALTGGLRVQHAAGDRFEGQEHKLLGAGGFEGSLKEVRELERALGINDLARYTPA
jgi:hypothetical protein